MSADYFVYLLVSMIYVWPNSNFFTRLICPHIFRFSHPAFYPHLPPICFLHQPHLYQPIPSEVGLLIALMSLSVLGVVNVGWIPLAPSFNHVTAVMSILAAGSVSLISNVAPLPNLTLSMSFTNFLKLCWPIRLGPPNFSATICCRLPTGIPVLGYHICPTG